MAKKVFMGVYGCQMNFADAERMEGELHGIGYERTDDMESADLILLHTCCVRETAEDKVYGKIGEIKRLKRERPELIFGITGCMAQKEQEKLIRRAPHIDFVLGTGRIGELVETVKRFEAPERPRHLVDIEGADTEIPENMSVVRKSGVSAWIPIMYGCNNFCTYCIVPYVRGRERSREPQDIIREVEEAVHDGFREVTLLGQNVNSYGKDHKKADFADLLKAVDEVEGIERVRFMTSHPKDLSDKLIETIKNGRHLCEHFHLPVQYGTDRILHAMNRVYTVADYKALLRKIREAVPHASITTDLIVGFPGETDEDFREMIAFLREARYDAAYTFIYSPRSGTPAAEMDGQVPDDVKHKRLHELMAVQNEISLEINERLKGETVEVLVEGPSKGDEGVWTGRTRTDKIVLWRHGAERVGDLAHVTITQPQTWVLKGELIGEGQSV